MMTIQNGSSDIIPVPENNTPAQSLQVNIFGNETIGSFIQESVEGIRRVENETLALFQKIRDDVLMPQQYGDKMRIEDVILVAPIAKDYLALLSQQADNRTKILKTITDLIRANQPQAALFQNFGGSGNSISPQQMEIQNLLANTEPPKPKPTPIRPKFEEEDDVPESSTSLNSGKKINVIHSYGYEPPQP